MAKVLSQDGNPKIRDHAKSTYAVKNYKNVRALNILSFHEANEDVTETGQTDCTSIAEDITMTEECSSRSIKDTRHVGPSSSEGSLHVDKTLIGHPNRENPNFKPRLSKDNGKAVRIYLLAH
jgi:hypothetical protein